MSVNGNMLSETMEKLNGTRGNGNLRISILSQTANSRLSSTKPSATNVTISVANVDRTIVTASFQEPLTNFSINQTSVKIEIFEASVGLTQLYVQKLS